jgi:hypothetical protein
LYNALSGYPLLLCKQVGLIIFYTFRGSSKVEEAVECYQRAANMFKMAKKWGAAGNAFCEAASLHLKAGSKHDAATNYVDAANCFKKSDPNGEICCWLLLLLAVARFIC